MSKLKESKSVVTTYDEAVRLLPDAVVAEGRAATAYRQALIAFQQAQDQMFDAIVAALRDASKILAEKRNFAEQAGGSAKTLRAIVDGGTVDPVHTRKVDDPMMTDAEFHHQRREFPDAVHLGKIEAKMNMATLIGGFSRFPGRTRLQEAAAMRFNTLAERAQLATARATDYSQPLVDSSGPQDDAILLRSDEARREMAGLRKSIGDEPFELLHRVIVEQTSARDIARAGGDAPSGRQVAQIGNRVKEGLDRCGDYWGLSGAAPDRTKIRREGQRLPLICRNSKQRNT
jgi:hypothetical protein